MSKYGVTFMKKARRNNIIPDAEDAGGDAEKKGSLRAIGERVTQVFLAMPLRLFLFLILLFAVVPLIVVILKIGIDHRDTLTLSQGLSVLLAAFLFPVFAWVSANLVLVKRLHKIFTAFHKLEKGELRARSGMGYSDYDIGYLAKAFDTMAEAIEARDGKLKQAINSLRELEHQWTNILDCLPDPAFAIDGEGKVILWNRAMEDLTGIRASEILGKGNREYAVPFYGRRMNMLIDCLSLSPAELAHRHKSIKRVGNTLYGTGPIKSHLPGQTIHTWGTASPLFDADGQKAGAVEIIRDITDHRKALIALRDGAAKYRALFEAASDAVTLMNDVAYTDCNRKAMDLFGCTREEFIGRRPIDFSPPKQADGRDSASAAAEKISGALSGTPQFFEWFHRRKDGTVFTAEISLVCIETTTDGFIIQSIMRDVTERKRAEALELHSRKLESVGQLGAGIAHEINTPVQFIGDNIHFIQNAVNDIFTLVSLYKRAVEDGGETGSLSAGREQLRERAREIDLPYLEQEIPRAIEQSLDGLERIDRIVKSLREFSQPGEKEETEFDLNHAVESSITLSRNVWKYTAELTTALDPDLPPVKCYPADINQVILNLIVNAAHAVQEKISAGEGGMGRIVISTKRDKDTVVLSVSDTGTGIPPDLRSRIFDPFFTTKEVGRGTGQGLAIAHSIVEKKHGGKISFETASGEGTTFRIRLPLKEEPA